MAKLSKVEADQLMEKFSKLTPTHFGYNPTSLRWSDGKREMELNMYTYSTWTIDSKEDKGRFHYEKISTLESNVFPWWQRVRLYFFFKRIWRKARDAWNADRAVKKREESLDAVRSILEREDA